MLKQFSKEEIAKAFQLSLIEQGIESLLAAQAAEILANDDVSKLNLGRTPDQQQVINQLWQQVTDNESRKQRVSA